MEIYNYCNAVFMINFKHLSYLILVFPLLTLHIKMIYEQYINERIITIIWFWPEISSKL